MKQRIFPAVLLTVGAMLTAVAFQPDWLKEIACLQFSIGVPLVLVGLFRLIFTKTVKKNFLISTTLTSLGMSAFAGGGLWCGFILMILGAFSERSTVMRPACAVVVAVCLCMCVSLLVLYFVFRSWRWSWLGFILDAVRGVLFVPAFLWATAIVVSIVENWYKYGEIAISVLR